VSFADEPQAVATSMGLPAGSVGRPRTSTALSRPSTVRTRVSTVDSVRLFDATPMAEYLHPAASPYPFGMAMPTTPVATSVAMPTSPTAPPATPYGATPLQQVAYPPMNQMVLQGGAYMYSGQPQPPMLQPQPQPVMMTTSYTSPAVLADPAASQAMRLRLASVHLPAKNSEQVTTVMLRNIPSKYSRDMLLADLDARGFWGSYDFFYLPIDFQTKYSVGYAFLNFVSEAELERFKQAYTGLKLSEDSGKVCEISPAKVQGKAKNVEQYRNSPVMGMEESYHPVIFQAGVRVPFPPPTRVLKAVKPRQCRPDGQQTR